MRRRATNPTGLILTALWPPPLSRPLEAAACPLQPASHAASGNASPAASPDSAAAADEPADSPDDASAMHLQAHAMVTASAAAAVGGPSAEHVMDGELPLLRRRTWPLISLRGRSGTAHAVPSRCRPAAHDALDLPVAGQKPATIARVVMLQAAEQLMRAQAGKGLAASGKAASAQQQASGNWS